MEAAAELALRLRAAANARLARYEPLALAAAPLLALLVARLAHAAASAVADRGLVAIAIAAVKSAPPPPSSFLPCRLIPHAVTPACWWRVCTLALLDVVLISLPRSAALPQVAAGSLQLHRGGEEEGEALDCLSHCISLHAGSKKFKPLLVLPTCTNRDAFAFFCSPVSSEIELSSHA